MDKLKLKNLYKLRKEILVLDNQIDSLNREYAQMNSKSLVGSPVITGLPNGKGDTSDKTGNHAISNVYIETQINILVAERLKIRCKVIEYTHGIEGIEEEYTRSIFNLRYGWGESWQGIANKLGGTADGIRMFHNRYIKKL